MKGTVKNKSIDMHDDIYMHPESHVDFKLGSFIIMQNKIIKQLHRYFIFILLLGVMKFLKYCVLICVIEALSTIHFVFGNYYFNTHLELSQFEKTNTHSVFAFPIFDFCSLYFSQN